MKKLITIIIVVFLLSLMVGITAFAEEPMEDISENGVEIIEEVKEDIKDESMEFAVAEEALAEIDSKEIDTTIVEENNNESENDVEITDEVIEEITDETEKPEVVEKELVEADSKVVDAAIVEEGNNETEYYEGIWNVEKESTADAEIPAIEANPIEKEIVSVNKQANFLGNEGETVFSAAVGSTVSGEQIANAYNFSGEVSSVSSDNDAVEVLFNEDGTFNVKIVREFTDAKISLVVGGEIVDIFLHDPYTDQYAGTEQSLRTAIDNINNDASKEGLIRLTNNITLSSTVEIPTDTIITLVLNGYSLTESYINNHGTLTIYQKTESDKVTSITNGNTTKYYCTLSAALDEVKDGETISLLTDVAYEINGVGLFNITKSITLDGQGHTISGYGNRSGNPTTLAINNGGSSLVDVTLKNLTINNSADDARPIETRGNIASLTLDNCTVTATGDFINYGTQGLTIGGYQSTNAIVNIKNGTKINTSYYPIIIFNPVTMDIQDSTINGFCCVYLYGENGSYGSYGSIVTVANSELIATNDCDGNDNDFGVFEMETAYIKIYLDNCNIKAVQNGTAVQTVFCENNAYGGEHSIASEYTVTGSKTKVLGDIFEDGSPYNFSKRVWNIQAGIYSDNRECLASYLATGKTVRDNEDEETKTTYPYLVDDRTCVVYDAEGIKGYYDTVSEAVTAATDGQIVKMLADSEENVTVNSGKIITIDLNGHVLKGKDSGTVIINNGTLTLTDTSATAVGKVTEGLTGVAQNGTLTLAGKVNITGNTENLYLPGGKTVTVADGFNGLVGVTLKNGLGAITSACNADYSSYFTSDNSNYVVAYDNDAKTVKISKNIADCSMAVSGAEYSGKEIKAEPVVKDGSTILVLDTDYTLSYKDNVNAGTATVTITGKGNYVESKDAVFTIVRKQLTVSGTTVEDKDYDGTTTATVNTGIPTGIIFGDDVILTATGTFDDEKAGDNKDVTVVYAISGEDAGNYLAPKASILKASIKTPYSPPSANPTWEQEEKGKITVPVEDGDAINVEAEIENSKAVVSDISAEIIEDVITSEDATGTVTVDCSSIGTKITEVEILTVNIKTVVESDAKELKVAMSDGSITLDKEALSNVADNAKSDTVILVVEEISKTVLNDKQNTALEAETDSSKIIAVVDSYILANAEKIKELGNGAARLEINSESFSYDRAEIVKSGHIVVYEILDDGTMKRIEFKIVDGKIVFDVNYLSQYIIVAE